MITRRSFLTRCSSVAAAAALPHALARAAVAAGPSPDGTILVLVRLGGGNDGLNTVVPVEDDRYHRLRPTLRVEKSQAVPLTGPHYLHPALVDLCPVFERGRLAVIQAVGYPSPDRSHFRSMDIWHTAGVEREERRSGWIGRAFADAPAGDESAPAAVAVVRDGLPLALAGARGTPPVIESIDSLSGIPRDLPPVADAPRRGKALEHVRAVERAAIRLSQRVAGLPRSNEDELPGTDLGRGLKTVLDLIRAGLGARVYYVAHDGFDTHTRQKDTHDALLRDLGRSLSRFVAALERDRRIDRVAVLTFSEFGRRARENGSRGTDHGAAGPMFALGAVKGGVIGDPPDLDDLEDGDVRFRVDFRQVYAAALERHLGLPSEPALGGRFTPVEVF